MFPYPAEEIGPRQGPVATRGITRLGEVPVQPACAPAGA